VVALPDTARVTPFQTELHQPELHQPELHQPELSTVSPGLCRGWGGATKWV
jgi:hypothetical protein